MTYQKAVQLIALFILLMIVQAVLIMFEFVTHDFTAPMMFMGGVTYSMFLLKITPNITIKRTDTNEVNKLKALLFESKLALDNQPDKYKGLRHVIESTLA